MSSQKEADVGITEFANGAEPISGILRCRYADFKVNEIDHEMHVAQLTSLEAADDGSAHKMQATFTDEAAITTCVAAFAKDVHPADADNLLAFLKLLQQQEVNRKTSKQRQSKQSDAEPAETAEGAGSQQEKPAYAQASPHVANETSKVTQDGAPELRLKNLTEKGVRTKVHMFFKEGHGLPRLVSDTVNNSDGSIDIRVMAQADASAAIKGQQAESSSGRGRGRGARGGRGGRGGERGGRNGRGAKRPRSGEEPPPDVRGLQSDQQASGTPYTHMVLKKVNRDSQDAVNSVAKCAGVSVRSFNTAGTKDKRGVTTQFVTVWNVSAAKLVKANGRMRGITVGNFSPSATSLRLGDLSGNLFTVVLRAVNGGSAQHASAAVTALRDSGFINYFGLQRFGSGSVPTHSIGVELMSARWEAAVKGVLHSHGSESPKTEAARKLYWESKNAAAAARAMPNNMHAEIACLEALAKNGANAWLQAAQAIPRNIRTMYMHAVQSFVWNSVASARLRMHGRHVIAGDLVISGGVWPDGGNAESPFNSNVYNPCKEVPAPGAGESEGVENNGRKSLKSDTAGTAPDRTARSRMDRVAVVTPDDVAKGCYTIDDVVLPLPGSDVQYPEWPPGDYELLAASGLEGPNDQEPGPVGGQALYERIAKSLGVDLSEACHSVKEFSMAALRGDYRRLIVRPRRLRHVFVKHRSMDEDIISEGTVVVENVVAKKKQTKKKSSQGEGSQPLEKTETESVPVDCVTDLEKDSCSGHVVTKQSEQQAIVTSSDLKDTDTHDSHACVNDSSAGRMLLEDAYGAEDGTTVVMHAPAAACVEDPKEGEVETGTRKEGESGEGGVMSLVLTFALPSSCYATMLLRELLKGSTATAVHKQAFADAGGVVGGLPGADVEGGEPGEGGGEE